LKRTVAEPALYPVPGPLLRKRWLALGMER
jgi:hypothetical protein